VAIAGSVVAVENPALGAALMVGALVAMTLDLTGAPALTRRLTPRRASQNVESREDGGKPGTLVLVAHVDAARDSGGWRLARRVLHELWRALAVAMARAAGLLRAAPAGGRGHRAGGGAVHPDRPAHRPHSRPRRRRALAAGAGDPGRRRRGDGAAPRRAARRRG